MDKIWANFGPLMRKHTAAGGQRKHVKNTNAGQIRDTKPKMGQMCVLEKL